MPTDDPAARTARELARLRLQVAELTEAVRKLAQLRPDKPTDLLTRRQAKAELGIGLRTLDRLVSAGVLTPVFVAGRMPRFKRSEVDQAKTTRRRRRKAPAAAPTPEE